MPVAGKGEEKKKAEQLVIEKVKYAEVLIDRGEKEEARAKLRPPRRFTKGVLLR
jgi:hypothetical protein